MYGILKVCSKLFIIVYIVVLITIGPVYSKGNVGKKIATGAAAAGALAIVGAATLLSGDDDDDEYERREEYRREQERLEEEKKKREIQDCLSRSKDNVPIVLGLLAQGTQIDIDKCIDISASTKLGRNGGHKRRKDQKITNISVSIDGRNIGNITPNDVCSSFQFRSPDPKYINSIILYPRRYNIKKGEDLYVHGDIHRGYDGEVVSHNKLGKLHLSGNKFIDEMQNKEATLSTQEHTVILKRRRGWKKVVIGKYKKEYFQQWTMKVCQKIPPQLPEELQDLQEQQLIKSIDKEIFGELDQEIQQPNSIDQGKANQEGAQKVDSINQTSDEQKLQKINDDVKQLDLDTVAKLPTITRKVPQPDNRNNNQEQLTKSEVEFIKEQVKKIQNDPNYADQIQIKGN